jgi:hypothetical protein
VYGLLIGGLLLTLNRGWVGDWLLTLVALLLGALFVVVAFAAVVWTLRREGG